ncbi:MAG TPA: protein phosphatase 2C domain-containing protein [Steroidobacteraceae bacterium]|nr:protein phosphatase 2C domain-containing protein [Steroidobacteraceae bacterium]
MNSIANAGWTAGARSETGYVRGSNEDRMSCVRLPEGFAYIVSDGMGGHNGGAEAAELTVRTLEQHLAAPKDAASIEKTIQEAFAAANARVYEAGHLGNPQTDGMGATAVVCVTRQASALIAHVGDSRAYLHRRGRLTRLTTDHTRAQGMVDAGVLTAAEAESHPDASILARAIGQLSTVEVDLGTWFRLKSGDEILLCSDGLSGEAEDPEISQALRPDVSPQRLADRLVALALRKGGHDNVTVQVIRYGNRRVPVDWKPVRYHAATLSILVLGCAAAIYWIDSRMQARLSTHALAMQAETRALRASVEEWKGLSEKNLAALDEQVAALNAMVKEFAASAAARAVEPARPIARLRPRAGAPRHAPSAVPSPPVQQPQPDPVTRTETEKPQAATTGEKDTT